MVYQTGPSIYYCEDLQSNPPPCMNCHRNWCFRTITLWDPIEWLDSHRHEDWMIVMGVTPWLRKYGTFLKFQATSESSWMFFQLSIVDWGLPPEIIQILDWECTPLKSTPSSGAQRGDDWRQTWWALVPLAVPARWRRPGGTPWICIPAGCAGCDCPFFSNRSCDWSNQDGDLSMI